MDSTQPWYALRTRHQHEGVVARNLANKGFHVFLPTYTAARRWKDRSKLLSLPLFPCYIFLRGAPERRLEIVTTPGAGDLVSSGGRPAPIPQSEIDSVRQIVEVCTGLEPHPFLKLGDWIRVISGPLAGIEGILVRKKNVSRLVVSVQLLSQSVSVEVDASTVERVARSARSEYQEKRINVCSSSLLKGSA